MLKDDAYDVQSRTSKTAGVLYLRNKSGLEREGSCLRHTMPKNNKIKHAVPPKELRKLSDRDPHTDIKAAKFANKE